MPAVLKTPYGEIKLVNGRIQTENASLFLMVKALILSQEPVGEMRVDPDGVVARWIVENIKGSEIIESEPPSRHGYPDDAVIMDLPDPPKSKSPKPQKNPAKNDFGNLVKDKLARKIE